MKLDVTKYILFLNNESKRLKKFINVRLPEIKRRLNDYKDELDKHDDGFIKGESIQSFNIHLSYRSYSGQEGSSDTYSDFAPDNAIFSKYFLEYLNNHTKEIFNEMADRMKEDAILEKNKALQELDDYRNNIEKII